MLSRPAQRSRDAGLIIDVPLFSQRLIEVLKGAGVRNLDLYDAEVIDREREKTYSHYKAVNIVGLVGLLPNFRTG
ncbi:hypothetical protein [Myxococcus xanthus]|uniref:hypothetical protein n=1 Tax=Myxococcus xanthus TaxID=34 RepID=UPI001F224300|nr:hypothetical protein [Myxococcus xanthus]